MNNHQTKSIKDILSNFSEQKQIKRPMQEARVVNLWPQLMGPLVNKYTEKIYVYQDTLFIKVTQSALKTELMYLQEDIIEKINKEIGEQLIRKIIVQ